MIGRLALAGLIVAFSVTSPVEAESPSASPAAAPSAVPSPALTAITSPDPAQAATCESHEVRPERCYLLGTARVTLRGAIRRSVTWPLQLGIGATSDYTPSIGLGYGPQDTKRLVIDLPGVPGESTTPEDGDSAGPGEAQLWWSLPDSVAGYGHACTVRYDADAVGRLTGGIRCPSERTARGQRYRVDVTFDAYPVVPGPLPTPEPTPVPEPPALADVVCDLLDSDDIEAVLGLTSGSVLLLDAGPGQCAGIAGDHEVAFIAVDEAATAADLVADGPYRGASCSALPLDLGDAASAASCAWTDGRAFVVGSVLRGSTLMVVTLASETLTAADLLTGTTGLLAAALDLIH
jgi:hypothetical protein